MVLFAVVVAAAAGVGVVVAVAVIAVTFTAAAAAAATTYYHHYHCDGDRSCYDVQGQAATSSRLLLSVFLLVLVAHRVERTST